MEEKKYKKGSKILYIIIFLAIVIIVSVTIVISEKQKNEEKFNNDLKNACAGFFEKEDFTELKDFIISLKNDSQKDKVYNELEIELKANADSNIANYEKSNKMVEVIDDELKNKDIDRKLNSILSIGKDLYTYNMCLINGNKDIEKEYYYLAYRVFEHGKSTIAKIDKDKANVLESKQKEISEKAKEEAKNYLLNKIKSTEIDQHISQSVVKAYIDIVKDEELTGLYNKWNKHNEELEKEEKEEREKEKKARKKQQGVRIGMSEQDVLDSSWGKPTKINKSVYSWGTHEQWVYPNDNYLYFENGKLTSIQTNE